MDWPGILKQVLLTALVSLLMFLMINVLFAQVLLATILNAAGTGGALTAIIFLGFMITLVVALVTAWATTPAASGGRKRAAYATILAMCCDVVFCVAAAYISVLYSYPDVIPAPASDNMLLSLLERGYFYIIAIPQVLSIYAIYGPGIMQFWIFSLLLFSLLYAIFFALLPPIRRH